MIDRRYFLMSSVGLAVAGAPWLLRRAGARTTVSGAAASPVIALVDRLVDGSALFAANARASGLHVLEFASDVASVWMRELEPRLRSEPTVMAGNTSASTLFCLEVLARDYGARIVARVESHAAVTWTLSSNPARRAALVPTAQPSWDRAHA